MPLVLCMGATTMPFLAHGTVVTPSNTEPAIETFNDVVVGTESAVVKINKKTMTTAETTVSEAGGAVRPAFAGGAVLALAYVSTDITMRSTRTEVDVLCPGAPPRALFNEIAHDAQLATDFGSALYLEQDGTFRRYSIGALCTPGVPTFADGLLAQRSLEAIGYAA